MAECCLCNVVLEIEDHQGGVMFLIEDEPAVTMESGDAVVIGGLAPEYQGPYTVTPGPEIQTLETQGKLLTDVVVMEQIPWNYGLITYNGRVITVS